MANLPRITDDKWRISDYDDSGNPIYAGYIEAYGNRYFVLQLNTSTGAVRYNVGPVTDYVSEDGGGEFLSWASGLSYGTYQSAF